jgi:hypothetical protein
MNDQVVMLTPRQIWELFGIPMSTLHDYCTQENDPLPSILIKGRGGKRGKRLIPVAPFYAWLARREVKPKAKASNA